MSFSAVVKRDPYSSSVCLSKSKYESSSKKVRHTSTEAASRCGVDKIKELIYYHGTSRESADKIRKYGFKVKYKTRGAADAIKRYNGSVDRFADKYNYFTSDIKVAAAYAKIHRDPDIVAISLDYKLKTDPESAGGIGDEKSFRTRHSIGTEKIIHLDCHEVLADESIRSILEQNTIGIEGAGDEVVSFINSCCESGAILNIDDIQKLINSGVDI